LRSSGGGSIDVFLDHLFDGARILESLLQILGANGLTLRNKIQNYPALEVDTNCLEREKKLEDSIKVYYELKEKKKSFQDCCFGTSFVIRNTTGHSLIWSDLFADERTYTVLYTNLVNAIFWSISKFISNPSTSTT
jgi:hypothetical protein